MTTIHLPGGDFEFDEAKPLGRGGFGQVFLGRSSNGAPVAVKVINLSGEEIAHRELQIAQELMGTNFNHIIGFLAAGSDPTDGRYFVVMPRAEFSLRQALKDKGKFDVRVVAQILLEIASGLAEVPAIVHRDLKPDNILWHQNKWKIADFGIARFVEEATSVHTLKGCLSPEYAAPEQWRYERATPATDVYALGCIGYTLLTGGAPFTDDHERRHATEPLPPFSCPEPRLLSLISAMARKVPTARPTASDIRTSLTTILSGPAQPSGAVSALAALGAKVAAQNQQAEAGRLDAARTQRARAQLAVAAQTMLSENIGRLWEKVRTAAPDATYSGSLHDAYRAQIKLANAGLEIGRVAGPLVRAGEFARSGWDVVSSSTITVRNNPNRAYGWEVSLWYVRLPGKTGYRWHEVGYFAPFGQGRTSPFSANGFQEADLAAAPILSNVSIGWGPRPIDGDEEHDFHERYLSLLVLAVESKLREPRNMPISAWTPETW